jgi:hypothetical protein
MNCDIKKNFDLTNENIGTLHCPEMFKKYKVTAK